MSLQHVIDVQQNAGVLSAQELKSLKAGKAFLIQYAVLTASLFATGLFAYLSFDWAHSNALWYGILLCTSTSFVGFMLTEWAYHQTTSVFLIVALGSIIVRLFNLTIACAVGIVFLKFPPTALIVSLLVSYLGYMIIEVLYLHNRALANGQ